MVSRLWTIVPALLAGVLVGAILVSLMAPPLTGTSVPSHGVSTATGCEKADDPRAWVAVVPEGDHQAVYLQNYSVVHDDPAVDVRSELTESGDGTDEWVLALTTRPADTEKVVPDGCQPRTLVDAAVAVPPTAQSLTVTLDGEQVAVVETAVNAPRFRYLDE